MNPEHVAWAAGFFDGEGCIRGRAYWRKNKDGSSRFTVDISLVVTQRDSEPLFFLAELFELGTVTERASPTKAWRWTVGGHRQVPAVLEAMRPHLRVKGPQADVALALIARVAMTRLGRGHVLAQDEIDARLSMLGSLSALKRSRQPFAGDQDRGHYRVKQPQSEGVER